MFFVCFVTALVAIFPRIDALKRPRKVFITFGYLQRLINRKQELQFQFGACVTPFTQLNEANFHFILFSLLLWGIIDISSLVFFRNDDFVKSKAGPSPGRKLAHLSAVMEWSGSLMVYINC